METYECPSVSSWASSASNIRKTTSVIPPSVRIGTRPTNNQQQLRLPEIAWLATQLAMPTASSQQLSGPMMQRHELSMFANVGMQMLAYFWCGRPLS